MIYEVNIFTKVLSRQSQEQRVVVNVCTFEPHVATFLA